MVFKLTTKFPMPENGIGTRVFMAVIAEVE
jgi:hypothetical protein